MIQVLASWSI